MTNRLIIFRQLKGVRGLWSGDQFKTHISLVNHPHLHPLHPSCSLALLPLCLGMIPGKSSGGWFCLVGTYVISKNAYEARILIHHSSFCGFSAVDAAIGNPYSRWANGLAPRISLFSFSLLTSLSVYLTFMFQSQHRPLCLGRRAYP